MGTAEQKIDVLIQKVEDLSVRISTIENKDSGTAVGPDDSDSRSRSNAQTASLSTPHVVPSVSDIRARMQGVLGVTQSPISATEESTVSSSDLNVNSELQQQYKTIKDSLSRVRLPPGFKTDTSLRGVGREHSKTAKIIHAASDYSETITKLLLTVDTSQPLSDDLLDCLITVVSAQIQYLQAEKSVCYVSGKFGDDVGSMFREFKQHASSFSATDIGILENCIQLSAARARGRGAQGRGQRGGFPNNRRWSSRGGRGSFQGRGAYPASDRTDSEQP